MILKKIIVLVTYELVNWKIMQLSLALLTLDCSELLFHSYTLGESCSLPADSISSYCRLRESQLIKLITFTFEMEKTSKSAKENEKFVYCTIYNTLNRNNEKN